MKFTRRFVDAISWEKPNIAGPDNLISLREAFNYVDQECNADKFRRQDPQIWPEEGDLIPHPQREEPTTPSSLFFGLFCPVDLTIINPAGKELSKERNDIGPNAFCVESDFDGDGSVDTFCKIHAPTIGEYSVQVVPEPEALPTDSFSLFAFSEQTITTLAEVTLISELPDDGYQLNVTWEGIDEDHDGVTPSPSQYVSIGPNPVSSAGCVFWLNLPEGLSQVKLMLFGITGRLVFETPLDVDSTRFPSAGTWNPVDQDGVLLANGPYVYVLVADGRIIGQGKMVIQR